MKKILTAVVLLCLAPDVSAQVRVPATPRPVNLEFRQGELGQVPAGWTLPESAAKVSYVAELREGGPHGTHAALLRNTGTTNPTTFGNLMQTVDALAFRGKLIRFAADVRTGELKGDSNARLWLRVDREGGKPAVLDNGADRRITAAEWKHYDVVVEVPADAEAISFGVLLIGLGNVWLGPATLETAAVPRREPAHALQGYALESVIAFIRLLGYVHYFHPSDEAQSVNWETFAIDGIRRVERAANPSALSTYLKQLFAPIASTLAIFPSRQKSPPSRLRYLVHGSELMTLRWHHQGLNSDSDPESVYKDERIKQVARIDDLESPELLYHAELGAGVSALIPLALPIDRDGTLPHRRRHKSSDRWAYTHFSVKDRATRLAAIGLYWNIPQHFYPYFDLTDADWHAVLVEALSSAAKDGDELHFVDILRRMASALHDGHARVSTLGDPRKFRPPLTWDWIENQLVITRLDKETEGIRVGDVVRTIEGRPAAEVIAETNRLVSGATPQFVLRQSLLLMAAGIKDSKILLGVGPASGAVHSVAIKRDISLHPFSLENRPSKVQEVRPGIYYVDLGGVSESEFKAALPDLSKASGIVFDLRGYVFGVRQILQHLTANTIYSPQWMIPSIELPDRVDMKFELKQWTVEPENPHLKARAIFLADARAMSRPETLLGMVEHYRIGPIVGSTSAGTNGDIIPIKLPGNYTTFITGMKVLKEDGSQHHGVGIRPTIAVARTIKGVAEGRDEILERGIEEALRPPGESQSAVR
jgi:C-terminal processing protease CtpA/Prc